MKIKISLILTASAGFILSCSTPHTLTQASPLTKEWTLESVPNALDSVGSVFAMNGHQQVFIAHIKIKTTPPGPAQIPNHSIDRTVSAGIFLDFLKVKGLDSASVGLSDTTSLNAKFVVKDATEIRQNDNLLEAFNLNKQLILDNLNFYGLQKSDVYFVSAILRSPNVLINLNKKVNAKLSIAAIIGNILKLHPAGISVNNKDTTSLKYELGEPLVLFYQLNKVNLNVVHSKGVASKDSVINGTVNAVPQQDLQLKITSRIGLKDLKK
jgi:hypothetical protein